jgi:hypothetical protein
VTTIGTLNLDGATDALPIGTPVTRSIPLSGNISGSGMTVSMSLTSPAGDPVLMDASKTISVTATPQNLRVASVSVNVTNQTVNSTSSIDLASVDSTIINHVLSGTLLLTVANPFNVSGTLTVKLTPQGLPTITKTISLSPGSSTPSITLSQTEIRNLLGHIVSVAYSGSVSATGPITVTPKQAVVVQSRLDLSLELGTVK